MFAFRVFGGDPRHPFGQRGRCGALGRSIESGVLRIAESGVELPRVDLLRFPKRKTSDYLESP